MKLTVPCQGDFNDRGVGAFEDFPPTNKPNRRKIEQAYLFDVHYGGGKTNVAVSSAREFGGEIG